MRRPANPQEGLQKAIKRACVEDTRCKMAGAPEKAQRASGLRGRTEDEREALRRRQLDP